ncbi:MAG: tetratricopeptide repeat protein [Elusimicrobia bacterium]|nr:tetratricopeptide repeat protein [Elusimicrobiota bacterium]
MRLALALLLAAAAPARAQKGVSAAHNDLRRGLDAYMSARFDDAVEALTEALEKSPGWKTASGLRSICLWTTGDVAGARRDAALAVSLTPKDAESFAARGFARFVRRELEPAAQDFMAAARRENRLSLAYFGMGSVRSSQERLKDALTNLNIAARLKPDAAAIYIVRGTVLEKMKNHRKAVDDYSKAIKLAPEFRWAFYYRGRAYRDLKEWRKAIPDLTNFLEFHPDFEQALYFRSNALYGAGDVKGALKDLERVIQLNPKNALALANRGVARAELGDKGSALSDLKRAKVLAPEKAAQIDSQIARIASSEPGQAVDSDVEITGTPGKGLSGRTAGELADDAGIAAQPDLPAPPPLPEDEPDPAGTSMLRTRGGKPSSRDAMPVVGTVSNAGEKSDEPDAPPDEAAPTDSEAALPRGSARSPAQASRRTAKPRPDILPGEGDSPSGPGEFMFLK